jgi:hypothetical protein
LLLLLLLPLTHFTRCYLRCTRLLGDDCVFLDYCIDCGHDERERFRITITRCRTYAKKECQETTRTAKKRIWTDQLMNCGQSFSLLLTFSRPPPPPQHKRCFGRSLEYTYHLQCGFQFSTLVRSLGAMFDLLNFLNFL